MASTLPAPRGLRWCGSGRNLHAPGTRTTSMADRCAPLREEHRGGASSRRSVITAFTARRRWRSAVRGGEIAFNGNRLAFQRIDQAQKLKRKPGSGSTVKILDFQ